MSFYRNHYVNFVHYRNWGKMVEDSALCMGKICSDWNTSVPVRWCKTGRQQHDSCLQCRINSTQRSLRLQSCTVSIQASSNKIDVFFFFLHLFADSGPLDKTAKSWILFIFYYRERSWMETDNTVIICDSFNTALAIWDNVCARSHSTAASPLAKMPRWYFKQCRAETSTFLW